MKQIGLDKFDSGRGELHIWESEFHKGAGIDLMWLVSYSTLGMCVILKRL